MRHKDIIRSALTLTALTIGAAALLIWTAQLSQERRTLARDDYRLKVIAQAFPAGFDNDPVKEAARRADGDAIYPLYRNDDLIGYAIETVAEDGYSGDIRLLIALDENHRILSVRALAHRETPGLGDRIDATDGWMRGFNGMHGGLGDADWTLMSDGGRLGNLTGASITARAVRNRVRMALSQEDNR